MKVKVMIVFGTRPEAIKMAPVCKQFLDDSENFETIILVTAQHREMLDQVLEIFEINPDIDLDLMQDNQNLSDLTAHVLAKINSHINKIKPDCILVHGDTTTTLAASMAAFYNNLPLGHVEAGLRTNNLLAPYPEEFNRQIASKISKWHFAPTDLSKKNLLEERISNENIFIVGNTVIDALHWVLSSIDENKEKKKEIEGLIDSKLSFNWRDTNFILITGHRRENFGRNFEEICEAISLLSDKYNDLHFVYPVHLNPNVQKPVNKILGEKNNIHLIDPLEYESFVFLMRNSYLVLTDSGGIQEEAPSLGKPVLVMRDVTERPEAIKAGTVKLVGSDKNKIVSEVDKLYSDRELYKKMSTAHNPFGDGYSGKKIYEIIKEYFYE
ncbi:MAG: UDP-N-acetylglucosamine 2-epimerase (non-hydrolyzing) [Dehalococcoidia bacterium]|nr:UDP-N-acetylglucosamine 2-epimerase (non-hydrolyzing) [Dehalococcoidia bacterium]